MQMNTPKLIDAHRGPARKQQRHERSLQHDLFADEARTSTAAVGAEFVLLALGELVQDLLELDLVVRALGAAAHGGAGTESGGTEELLVPTATRSVLSAEKNLKLLSGSRDAFHPITQNPKTSNL